MMENTKDKKMERLVAMYAGRAMLDFMPDDETFPKHAVETLMKEATVVNTVLECARRHLRKQGMTDDEIEKAFKAEMPELEKEIQDSDVTDNTLDKIFKSKN